jgi:G3E family GTPase
MVDCLHVIPHLREEKSENSVNQAVQQIAFADRILLNKVSYPLELYRTLEAEQQSK